MRKSLRVMVAALSGALLAAAPALAQSPPPAKVNYRGTIGSGGLGGVIYVMAAGFASLAGKHVPGLSLSVESTSGSVELAKRVGSGDLPFATASNDAVFYANIGKREFKEKFDENRAVLGGNTGQVHLYVLASSPYRTWADLRGKRIALTSAASLNFTYFSIVWAALGLKPTDYKPEWIQSGQYADALRDGQVDAALLVAGYPVSAVNEVASTKGIRLLPIPEEVIQRLLPEHPYWHREVIPTTAYKGMEAEVPTLGNTTILIANKNVPNDVVYLLTKTILEHPDDVSGMHPAGREWTKPFALRGVSVVPMHPGAERYFREIGLVK